MSRPRRYTAQRALEVLSQYNESDTDSENEEIPEDVRQELDQASEYNGDSDQYSANNSEEEEGEEMEIEQTQAEESYVARDGTTWVRLSGRHSDLHTPASSSSENIIHTAPGPSSSSRRKISSVITSFLQIVDEAMFRKIHACTVAHARSANDTKFEISLEDIYSFVGLLFARGVFIAKNEPLDSLWSNEYGRNIFKSTMSRNKFQFIMKHLRFDEKSTRSERRQTDKFCPIRELWTRFVENSQSAFNPSAELTVDEQLFPMKSRCPFIQFIPTKPDKYGSKFWLLCDAIERYIYNAQPYLGKVETENSRGMQLGEFVVMKLLEKYFGGGYNVTTDSFFTSLSLSRNLLSKNITLVGTMKSNRREIPPVLHHEKEKPVKTFLAAKVPSEKSCLFSYKAKKDKNVILLSSFHSTASMIDDVPEVIRFYNNTKYGVDTVDQMARQYSTKSSSRRWPFQIFCNMLDLAAINSHTLFKEVCGSNMSRRDYLITMANELIALSPKPEIKASKTPKHTEQSNKRVKYRLCKINCTRSSCIHCEKFVCGSCTNIVCKECS